MSILFHFTLRVFLVDVIGFVKSMGKLEEFANKPGKYLLRMVLSDDKSVTIF